MKIKAILIYKIDGKIVYWYYIYLMYATKNENLLLYLKSYVFQHHR